MDFHTCIYKTPSINAQCRSMPIKINTDHCRSMLINSDQCRSVNISKKLSIPLNPDQSEWRGILNRHWSTLGSMPEFWSALGIEWGSYVLNLLAFDTISLNCRIYLLLNSKIIPQNVAAAKWIFTPHISDVTGVIFLTSFVCVCMCRLAISADRTDMQTWILAWRSSGMISIVDRPTPKTRLIKEV